MLELNILVLLGQLRVNKKAGGNADKLKITNYRVQVSYKEIKRAVDQESWIIQFECLAPFYSWTLLFTLPFHKKRESVFSEMIQGEAYCLLPFAGFKILEVHWYCQPCECVKIHSRSCLMTDGIFCITCFLIPCVYERNMWMRMVDFWDKAVAERG